MRKCKVPICPREQRTSGWCAAHYMQIYTHGRVIKENIGLSVPRNCKPYRRKNVGKCLEDGCERVQMAGNLCNMHYQRKRDKIEREREAARYDEK